MLYHLLFRYGDSVKNYDIETRAILFAEYMLKNKSTVRATAKHFGYSKSTVHKDLSVRLKEVNYAIYKEICFLLNENLSTRHIRGGNATRQKYTELKTNG